MKKPREKSGEEKEGEIVKQGNEGEAKGGQDNLHKQGRGGK